MSVISGNVVKDYYSELDNGWYIANRSAIQNSEQADVVCEQLVSDARMERLKSAGCAVMGGTIVLLFTGVGLLASKIAALAIGCLVFPLYIVPPLYGLITLLGGMGVGGAISYITIKRFSSEFFQHVKEHWDYADHLFQQAHAVRLHKALL